MYLYCHKNVFNAVFQDRAKIMTRRRPPSRKGRKPVTNSAMSPVSPVQSPMSEHKPVVPTIPSSKSADIFGNDDLLDGLSIPPSVSRLTNNTGGKDIFSDDMFSKSTKEQNINDDLFDSSKRTSNEKTSSDTVKKDFDIFSDVLHSVPSKKTEKIIPSIPHEEDDDIFSVPKTKKKDIINDVMDNNADDIFESVSENTPVRNIREKKDYSSINAAADSVEKTKTPAPSAVEEDDIFADSSLHKEGKFQLHLLKYVMLQKSSHLKTNTRRPARKINLW